MSPALAGALVGLLGGLGLAVVTVRLGARRIRLDDRLAPYLRPRRVTSSLMSSERPARGPVRSLERLLEPLLADGQRLVARLGSPAAELRARLDRAGRQQSVEEFRAGQVVWGALGVAAGLALGLALLMARSVPVPALVVLVVLSGVAGVLGRDWLLTREVRRRETAILAELPTVTELLALAVAAGEGALGALERVVRSTHGELSRDLAHVLADVRAGTPLVVALEAFAGRTGVPPLATFAEAVAVAVERGTPLADVLRAQAQDVRESGRRALMEAGGRKEVQMMVPVVFLLLPVTVAFAAFPSLFVLRVGL
jgi:tight adherence protein C